VRPWILSLVLGTLLVVPGVSGTTLGEGWTQVQEALESGDATALQENGEQFLVLGKDLGIRRLTPYSRAMLAWSERRTGPLGQAAEALAGRLDPFSPAVAFHRARVAWDGGSYFEAGRAYLRGWFFLVRSWSGRRALLTSLVPWFLLALAAAVAMGIVFQAVRFLPELFHDGWELGRLLFSRNNAVVFAAVVVLLPVFAGLGPVWLAAWLFALSWSYLGRKGRIIAGAVWILGLSLVPLNEVWLHRMLRPAGAPAESVALLLERRADPSVLQELSALDKPLGGSESFHLVAGALFRLHGDELSSRAHFQKAALVNENDPRPLVYLGNISLDDGNPAGAIQYYRQALTRDPRNALAYYNLSRAYDRTYSFEEADRMRRKARELSGGKEFGPPPGMESDRITDPSLGWNDLERMRREAGAAGWKAAGLAAPKLELRTLFFHPIPLAVFFTGVLGLLLLVARDRWMWTSKACARCGKVFCPRCKTATESDAYCSQCISVFLKRDAVAIEQHAVKVEQIRRRQAWERLGRRFMAVVAPGSGQVLLGAWIRGMLTAFLVLLGVVGALVWLPAFVAPLESELPALPLQVIFLTGAAGLWIRSVAVSWTRR